MEEKTIKKGDLLKAYYEVTANDESTKQLLWSTYDWNGYWYFNGESRGRFI